MQRGDAPDSLVIELVASKDPIFELTGNDLHVTYSVTSTQARQGFLLNIKHLDNRVVKLSFSPSEVKSNQNTFVIKNEGFPVFKSSSAKKRYGDLIVKFEVEVEDIES